MNCVLLLLFLFINKPSDIPKPNEPSKNAQLMEVTEGWRYRWGDSPLDSNKIRVWTYKVLDESEWRSHDYSNGITNPPNRQDREVLW